MTADIPGTALPGGRADAVRARKTCLKVAEFIFKGSVETWDEVAEEAEEDDATDFFEPVDGLVAVAAFLVLPLPLESQQVSSHGLKVPSESMSSLRVSDAVLLYETTLMEDSSSLGFPPHRGQAKVGWVS